MSKKLKKGDLVRMSMHTRYPNSYDNPHDQYGLVVCEGELEDDTYIIRWFNGNRNSSYRYKENYIYNDIIPIPNKERCRVVLVGGRVYIKSKFLLATNIITSSSIIHENNTDIKNQLVRFFDKLSMELFDKDIQYLDCYYKNNFKNYFNDDFRLTFSSEFYTSNIKKYTDEKKDFILLNKIDFNYD